MEFQNRLFQSSKIHLMSKLNSGKVTLIGRNPSLSRPRRRLSRIGQAINDVITMKLLGWKQEHKSKSKEISYEQDEGGKKEKGRSWSPGV